MEAHKQEMDEYKGSTTSPKSSNKKYHSRKKRNFVKYESYETKKSKAIDFYPQQQEDDSQDIPPEDPAVQRERAR